MKRMLAYLACVVVCVVVCVAVCVAVLLGILILAGPAPFFGPTSPQQGSQTHRAPLPTGDTLINETRFTYGWQDGRCTSSTLAVRWKATAEVEPIAAATGLLPNVLHITIVTNEEHLVVATGGKVFFRQRTGRKGEWSIWRLNSSPEIFGFIKDYLDRHYPGSYTTKTNGSSEDTCLRMPGNLGQNEYPMTIYPEGTAAQEFEYRPPKLPYEVEAIDLNKRRLTAVPRTKNHRLPKLVFAEQEPFGAWKFDLAETRKENKE
jgi:hypothetical protein